MTDEVITYKKVYYYQYKKYASEPQNGYKLLNGFYYKNNADEYILGYFVFEEGGDCMFYDENKHLLYKSSTYTPELYYPTNGELYQNILDSEKKNAKFGRGGAGANRSRGKKRSRRNKKQRKNKTKSKK
jgi:hypothetical protein